MLVANVLPEGDGAANRMALSPNPFEVYTAHGGANETAPAQGDRRRRTRIRVHWPVVLTRDGVDALETVTENLSSSGFYCFSPKPVLPGETVFCTLKAPTYDPKGDQRTITLECKAVALRAEATGDGLFGIACRIEDYHLAP